MQCWIVFRFYIHLGEKDKKAPEANYLLYIFSVYFLDQPLQSRRYGNVSLSAHMRTYISKSVRARASKCFGNIHMMLVHVLNIVLKAFLSV